MGFELVDKTLQQFFYRLGYIIGSHPGYFIIVPVLLTALLVTGFQQLDYEYDPEYLFSPVDGQAKHERAVMEEHFPTNYSAFKSSRMTRVGRFGRLIITPKDEGGMLRTHVWTQMLYLDQIVYNITVYNSEGDALTYVDLCARFNGKCYDNEILEISDLIPNIEANQINLTYPVYFNPYTFQSYPLPAFFGGVEMTDINVITKVSALSLAYFLDVSEEWMEKTGDDWERKLLNSIQTLGKEYAPDLEIGIFVSNTPSWEMEKARLSVTFNLCFNIAAMVLFTMIASTTADAAKSKPLVGLIGLISATMATLAGFGFCCYVGVEFISLNMAAPFLLLGIGIDDTFVMLSSWRRSGAIRSLPERMGSCFSDAAVSITVTSLTDFLSFMCGAITPFPCVRIFCLYTGVSVAFIYLWQCTLFGGFLALTGMLEENNRHGLCCVKVTPLSMIDDSKVGCFKRFFLTGGINPEDPANPQDNKDHAGMAFLRDKLGGLLTKKWVKVTVLVCYATYLGFACWGVTNIKEGLDKKNTANYNSYSIDYYRMEDRFFKKYAFTISVAFTGPNLDFSDSELHVKIEKILSEMESSHYIDGQVTQSWLRDFLDYVNRSKEYGDVSVDISTPEKFATTLKEAYLNDPSSPLNLDVKFNENETRVTAARFLIQGHNIVNSVMEQEMVAELRDICAQYSTDELEVVVFHPFFIFIDQYLAIRPQTIQCVLVTALVMVIIALIMIPSFICSLWISLSIISIEIGVVGYMTWWGVSLDGVALINLIMCIGFSVDFSAHICYHYLVEENQTSDERIKSSLYALGIPILQGAGSTILGVIGLAFAPNYLFVTFFKMIFLVILLGALHGLILLPVLLSLLGPDSISKCVDDASVKERRASSSKSTRSSGLSTPTMSYTINHGFVPDILELRGHKFPRSDTFPSQLAITSHGYLAKKHLVSEADLKSLQRIEEEKARKAKEPSRQVEKKQQRSRSKSEGHQKRKEGGSNSKSNEPRVNSRKSSKADISTTEPGLKVHPSKTPVGKSKSHVPVSSFYVHPMMDPSFSFTSGSTSVDPEADPQEHRNLRRFYSVPYHEFMNEVRDYSSDESSSGIRFKAQRRKGPLKKQGPVHKKAARNSQGNKRTPLTSSTTASPTSSSMSSPDNFKR